MAALVRRLYDEGIVDVSSIGLNFTPISANTRYNNPKSFLKENPPKCDDAMRWTFIPLKTRIMNVATSFTGTIRVTS